jgi:hypothetical protein
MIDVLAALLIGLAVVKVLVLAIHTPAWLGFAKVLAANRTVTTLVFYVLAGVMLSMLLASGLTIEQILAVCLFAAVLIMPGLVPYMDHVLRALEGRTFGQMMREQWFYTLIWAVLLTWGAYALLVG